MTTDAWDEVVLGELPPEVSTVYGTGDGRHIGWFEPVEGGVRFSWDFAPGERFDSVEAAEDGDLFYSPRRDRVAFWGVRGDDSFVVVDGSEHGPYDAYTRNVPPTFSADGRRVAHGVSPRGAFASTGRSPFYLAVDGAIDTSHEIAPVAAVFSPDGERIAYVAESGEATARRWAVVDGQSGPDFDYVGLLTFSPDGRRFAYAGSRDGRWLAVLDGREGTSADEVAAFAFSPDGSRFAYVMDEGGRMCVAVGDEQDPWHVIVRSPVFGRSDRLAYLAADLAADKRRFRMIVGAEAGPEFDAIMWKPNVPEPTSDEWRPAYGFSGDGQHFGYIAVAARRGGGLLRRSHDDFLLVRDGAVVELGVDEVTSGVAFSPDGEHVAMSARQGRDHFVIVDGDRGQPFGMVWPPRWSPDGRLAYAARTRNGKLYVVRDGEPGPECDLITTWISGEGAQGGAEKGRTFEFSSDGRHIAAVGTIGGIERPIVDGVLGPACDKVFFPVFTEGRVSFIVVKGGTFVRASRQLA